MIAATREEIEAGFVLKQPYPFVRTTWLPLDPEASMALTWKPGVNYETAYWGDSPTEYTQAHGLGSVVYTVIAVCPLPRPYPTRVFYKRHWIDPDDREFGKNLLRLTTLQAFRAWRFRNPLEKFGVEDVKDLSETEKLALLKPAEGG